MHTYKKFLALMLISGVAVSSESITSGQEQNSTRLRAPSMSGGLLSPSLSRVQQNILNAADGDNETTSLADSIGSMNEEGLLQALGQSQEITGSTETTYRPTGYEELYKLVSLEAYTSKFLADIDNPLISRTVLRSNSEGDIRAVFPTIFDDLRQKNQPSSESKGYNYYRENVRKLLVIWSTITICGEKLFDNAISQSVGNMAHENEEYRMAGFNLLLENIKNIESFITFFDKWGDFISQIMHDQRRSLLEERSKIQRSKSHTSSLSISEPGTITSVTQKSTLESFDIFPIIVRLRSQLQDAQMCMALKFTARKDILKSELWKSVGESILERKVVREALEKKADASSSSVDVSVSSPRALSSKQLKKEASKKNVRSEAAASSSKQLKKEVSKKNVRSEATASSSKQLKKEVSKKNVRSEATASSSTDVSAPSPRN